MLCGWEWFPDNKGLVSGIILAGYGFGAFFYGYISTALVNPHDIQPHKDGDKLFPQEVSDNFPKMFRICLISWAVLCSIGIIFVRRNPEFVKNQKISER